MIYREGGVYTYSYKNETAIERILKSPMEGYYEQSGVIIDFDVYNDNEFTSRIKDLETIYTSVDLPQYLKGVEFIYTIYDSHLDVFVTNIIVSPNINNFNYKILSYLKQIAITTR